MTFRQVAVVCEGQTEEAFVRRVLQLPASNQNVHLQPIIVKTARPAGRAAFKGGGSWRGYREELLRVERSTQYSLVTTMIDLYAYPADAPGAADTSPHPYDQAEVRESAVLAALPFAHGRFLPHLLVHEMETLVIAAGAAAGHLLGDSRVGERLRDLVKEFDGDPHLIDGGGATAPSKRLSQLVQGYSKVTDGIDAILDAGLESVVVACPRFGDWWRRVLGEEEGPIGRSR